MRTKGVRGKLVCLLLVVLAAFSAVALACGHAHTYASEWTYSQTEHWHASTCGDGGVSGKTAHDFAAQIVPTCDGGYYTIYTCICGFSYTDNPDGAGHAFSAFYSNDTEKHWFEATCEHKGLRLAEEPHEFTVTVVAPCTVDGYTLHTCKCGYSYKDAPTKATGLHEFDSEHWSHNADLHWHAALCAHTDETKDLDEHDFTETTVAPTETEAGYTARACDTCGYETAVTTFSPLLTFAAASDKQSYMVSGVNIPAGTTPEIAIPASYKGIAVTEIAVDAFAGSAVKKITIPSSIGMIPVGFAKNCAALTEVVIETEIQKLPASAFEGCANLKKVTMPTTVTEIGALAFRNCALLDDIDLHAGLKIVGLSAFNGCAALNVPLPATLQEIHEYAFKGCTSLKEVELPSALTVMKTQAFKDCTSLEKLTVHAPLIGTSAFEGCSKLADVTVQNTQVVGANAFKDCTVLETLALPNSVTNVGAGAFDGTGLLSTKGGVQYACNIAMKYESGASITLEAGTVGVAEGAFRGAAITAVTLNEEDIRFISDNAFRSCEGLTQIEFPASLKHIGMAAFRASGVASVTIPATVETVGDYAFFDCKSLTTVSVAAKRIGSFAFTYTPNHNQTIPDGVCLTGLTIGEGVEVIGSNAFQYLQATSVTLPSTLTSIGQYAFARSKLTAVTIPAKVAYIGEYAFLGCQDLATVTFAETTGWKAGSTALSAGDLTAQNLKVTHVTKAWTRG